jgi:hypothetical protein
MVRGRANTPRSLFGALGLIAGLFAMFPAGALGSGSAVYTSIKLPDTGQCLHGNPSINCNDYDLKTSVYLSGGPASGPGLPDGEYFFAILDPGVQNGGVEDGAVGNLSDTTDADVAGPDAGGGDLRANRRFTISGGAITAYGGTHDSGTGVNSPLVIGAAPFDDTSNHGGVYILAVCEDVANPDPSKCKYDAFKVEESACQEDCEGSPADDLVVTKDATPTFKRTFPWSITKDVDKTIVKQVGGTATFNYTIVATKGAGIDSEWKVKGTIQVFNPNTGDVDGVDVTDEIVSGNVEPNCVVTGGTDQTIPGNSSSSFDYVCTYANEPNPHAATNTATATWGDQDVDGHPLAAGSDDGTFDFDFDVQDVDNPKLVDDCATVTDPQSPDPPLPDDTCDTTTFHYAKSFNVPNFGCATHDNTAVVTTDDLGLTDDADQSVQVCGPVRTGALTMGFWQNKNGQGIIKAGSSTAGVCNSGTWLRQYAPFQDLSTTATCNQVATYVTNIIKAASASGASMNKMLKGQMLATALDVYFSDPALGGNRIGAPGPIGGVAIDLTLICKDIATCSILYDVSGAFGGATSLTVSQMLAYAASQSNSGGSVWYGQVKKTQEKAKDAFDAVNNQVAFAP